MKITKKATRLTKKQIESLPEPQQRHYALWRYMTSHQCSLAVAYENVYHVAPPTAKANASRLSKTEAWLSLVDRMQEAIGRSPEDIKTEITATMLSVLRDKKAYPGDRIKAAAVLAQVYGITEQKISLKVDAVSQYAENVLRASESQPLISSSPYCLPEPSPTSSSPSPF